MLQRKINRFSVRVLLKSKSANNLVLFTDATPSARHFSLPRLNNSFGGDFHYRLNPGNFVCYSRKGWFFPLMGGSTTVWAVLFTDGTLKRRGFHKFSSITLVGTLTAVIHLFSFTERCYKWNRFADEQSLFRNGSAIRTIGWHTLCDQPLIRIAFVKSFVYHDFSYYPVSDHRVKVGSN